MAGRLRAITPEQLAWAFVALGVAIVLWNASAYPAGAGYDAASHREYADFLIQHHRLPYRNETPEYYSPPLYYLVAGGATWIGKQLGVFGDPHKLGQLLNVPAVIGTLLLVVALARLLWPERRWIAPAAAGFVALSPVLTRTASMFGPEPTDLFVSMLCLYLAARLLLRRAYRWPAAFGLGIALGCGEMVRQFSLWTLAVVVLAFGAAMWARAGDRRALLRTLAVVIVGTAIVALPWYVYRAIHYGNPIFDRPQSSKPLWDRPAGELLRRPGAARPVHEAVPAEHGQPRLAGDLLGHLGRLVRGVRLGQGDAREPVACAQRLARVPERAGHRAHPARDRRLAAAPCRLAAAP